jgi:hypothetical protein
MSKIQAKHFNAYQPQHDNSNNQFCYLHSHRKTNPRVELEGTPRTLLSIYE